ncbi:MAG: sulfotransferase domain-containing protein [Caulobacteraceae bacterium]
MLTRAPAKVVRDWYRDSRQWEGYRPRGGDVVIATAPKVGTTWMQRIVSLLIFQSPEPRHLGALSPWLDCRFQMPIEAALPMIEAQTHQRFLKSHLPLDALPIYDEVRYIHVAREGRDACMSFLNHFNSYVPEALERFDAIGLFDPTIGRPMPRPPTTAREFFLYWLADGGADRTTIMASDYFDIERSYWIERGRANLLMVHFNDLKADLAGEMKRIADFLAIEVAEELWPRLVAAATFEAMKRDGGTLMAGAERGFRNGHETFLHSGTNERWRGIFTDADLELYRRKIEAALSPGLIGWLEGGRRLAGDPREAPD